jgi:hypothetical protein
VDDLLKCNFGPVTGTSSCRLSLQPVEGPQGTAPCSLLVLLS